MVRPQQRPDPAARHTRRCAGSLTGIVHEGQFSIWQTENPKNHMCENQTNGGTAMRASDSGDDARDGKDVWAPWMHKVRGRSRPFIENGLAFGLYVITQQLLIMPFLARSIGEDSFGQVILFLAVFNILCNVLGEELGNALIVKARTYSSYRGSGDFAALLAISLTIATVVVALVAIIFRLSPLFILVGGATILIGVVRFYLIAHWKLSLQFRLILVTNLIYALGATTGLVATRFGGMTLLPFFLGETAALLFVVSKRFMEPGLPGKADRRLTREFGATASLYWQLAVAALVINVVGYMDRLLILPILGSSAMAIYYAASSIAKSAIAIINPVAGVVLAKLAHLETARGNAVVEALVKRLPILFSVLLIASAGASLGGVALLYPQYQSSAASIILPVGLMTALSATSAIMKPFIIRFYSRILYLASNLLFGGTLVLGYITLAEQFGLIGFAYAGVLARVVQLIAYLVLLRTGANR